MEERDPLSEQVIGAAIEVHRILGPGLLESVYQKCLAQELTLRGVPFREQVAVPIVYKGVSLIARCSWTSSSRTGWLSS
jgi:GxxExxY protein